MLGLGEIPALILWGLCQMLAKAIFCKMKNIDIKLENIYIII